MFVAEAGCNTTVNDFLEPWYKAEHKQRERQALEIKHTLAWTPWLEKARLLVVVVVAADVLWRNHRNIYQSGIHWVPDTQSVPFGAILFCKVYWLAQGDRFNALKMCWSTHDLVVVYFMACIVKFNSHPPSWLSGCGILQLSRRSQVWCPVLWLHSNVGRMWARFCA